MRIAPRTPRGPEILRRGRARRASNHVRPVLQGLETRFLLASTDPFAPTAGEQYMLELINRARANPAAEGQRLVAIAKTDPVIQAATRNWDLNRFLQVIGGYGPLPPLAFNTSLIEAARDHDTAMLAANTQSHSTTGYLNNPQVATADDGQAYYPTGATGWATGENIFAYSSNVNGSGDQAYVDYFETAFLLDWGNPDFGHLKNLLAPGPAAPGSSYPFSEIGIGLLTGVTPTNPPASNNPIAANRGLNVGPALVTQEFGWRNGNALLTGVVYRDGDGNNFYTPGEGIGSVVIQAVGQQGQGIFRTQTWDSGGYSLALPPGTYQVVATGNLPAPRSSTITIGQDNVQWDAQLPATDGNTAGAVTAASSNKGTSAASAGTVTSPAATPQGPLALAKKRPRNPIHSSGTRRTSHRIGRKLKHFNNPRG
jgi:hypothetical protein